MAWEYDFFNSLCSSDDQATSHYMNQHCVIYNWIRRNKTSVTFENDIKYMNQQNALKFNLQKGNHFI